MRRAAAVLLALAIGLAPVVAHAEPPGQSVELEQCPASDGIIPSGGCRVPFKGNLSDATRWAHVKSLRDRAEKERDAAVLEKQDARARQSSAESELASVKGSKPPSWGVLIGVTGAALVLGVIGGVALVYAAKK